MVRFLQTGCFADNGNVMRLIEGSCLAGDTKPTANVANGSIMVETDTGKVFFYNEASETWIEQFSFQG